MSFVAKEVLKESRQPEVPGLFGELSGNGQISPGLYMISFSIEPHFAFFLIRPSLALSRAGIRPISIFKTAFGASNGAQTNDMFGHLIELSSNLILNVAFGLSHG